MDFKNCNWPLGIKELKTYLRSIANEKYKNFSKSLVPGDFEMLGVNIPTLKKIGREIYRGDYESFLSTDDSGIFELAFLKGQVIANIKDPDEYEKWFLWYIPSITNWSLCDSFIAASKVIKKDEERFFKIAEELIKQDAEFKNRVGFVILLDYFVDDNHKARILKLLEGYASDRYYANMALAWLLSELYVKYPEETFEFLINGGMSEEVMKYTVRKIKDSYRVSQENKDKLKRLA